MRAERQKATAAHRVRGGRSYVRVAFRTPAAMADDAAGLLVAHGALGCAVGGDHRIANRRATVGLDAYFERLSPARLRAIRRAMAAAGMLVRAERAPRRVRIADPGWATAWKERFAPLSVGPRLVIVPPWSAAKFLPAPSAASAAGRLRIVINPGQAFGTGHHPTTYGALRALDELCAERRFKRALDVGTGSGVLAIAMRLFGIPRVTAVDIDAAALDNARENAALNSMRRTIRFSTTPVERLRGRFGLITANILSSTLSAMAATLKRLLGRGGRLVLGGILNREAPAVLRSFRPGLRLVGMRRDRGWTTLVFAR
jgi:ribosomal protein L11 methyltransferase